MPRRSRICRRPRRRRSGFATTSPTTSTMVNRMEVWRKQIEDQLKANAAQGGDRQAAERSRTSTILDVELKLVSRSEMLSDDKYFPGGLQGLHEPDLAERRRRPGRERRSGQHRLQADRHADAGAARRSKRIWRRRRPGSKSCCPPTCRPSTSAMAGQGPADRADRGPIETPIGSLPAVELVDRRDFLCAAVGVPPELFGGDRRDRLDDRGARMARRSDLRAADDDVGQRAGHLLDESRG